MVGRPWTHVAVTAMVATTAACSSAATPPANEPTAATVTTASASPAEVLSRSLEAMTGTTVRVHIGGTKDRTYDLDLPHRLASGTIPGQDMRLIGDDYYSLLSTGKWVHFSLTKLGAVGTDGILSDPRLDVIPALLAGQTGATETAPGHIFGTVDLSKARDANQGPRRLAIDVIRYFGGSSPGPLSMSATVDSQGRLTEFVYTYGAQTTPITLTRYGEPVTVQAPPAGTVREATPTEYVGVAKLYEV